VITNSIIWNDGGKRSGNMTFTHRWFGYAARHGVSSASGIMDS